MIRACDLYPGDLDRHLCIWEADPEHEVGARARLQSRSPLLTRAEDLAGLERPLTGPRLITVAFLDDYDSRWATALVDRMSQRLRQRIERVRIDLDLALGCFRSRGTHDVTVTLTKLCRLCDAGSKILGITDHDLFVPGMNFVFGEAQLQGRAAIVSTHRLREEFYGLPPDPRLMFERTLKEALHELGHTYGLMHCPTPGCVMHASAGVGAVDLKKSRFCTNCQALLAVGELAEACAGR